MVRLASSQLECAAFFNHTKRIDFNVPAWWFVLTEATGRHQWANHRGSSDRSYGTLLSRRDVYWRWKYNPDGPVVVG